jgi:hypothetical protein
MGQNLPGGREWHPAIFFRGDAVNVGNQVRGLYKESRDVGMACYDQLPPAIRELMRNAVHMLATSPRLGMLRAGWTVEALHDQLIHHDASFVRRDAQADWGGQAADYLAAQRPRRRRDWLDKPPRSRL